MRWRSRLAGLAAAVAVGAGYGDHAAAAPDPFAFFESAVHLGRADRDRLDRRELVVRILPARDGEIGVFAAARLDAAPETLVTWTRAIDQLKKGPFVGAIRRFSDPPVLEDLEGLWLDEPDVEALRKCRPGRCDVKLLAGEIDCLRTAAAGAGERWPDAVQIEFRHVLLDRIHAYQAGDPDIAESLAGYPDMDLSDSESFLYWSKERYGSAKPVVAATHVTIVHPGQPGVPEVLVLGKEIFATHYRNASLGMTAVVLDSTRHVNYLVYVNRSHVDVLGGVFGGVKRRLIEGRIRSESSDLLTRVRKRLEDGSPAP